MVRGVCNRLVPSSDFYIVTLYVPGRLNSAPAVAVVTFEAHVVEQRRSNILIDTDVLAPEGFVIDLKR
ncbi:uncharacterized protein BDZ99DRAFT_468570 [Mytilinidion resinicola]|uniref:Uncharacterized protein n=1 Tax=Mytilinidion resinicola TaxID=574789 RepID=A0A6A6Y2K2_9PEZI|nr:uncharacterized protein BDZ99DRAFT_468570 [Mytilinidion resinicola]KAF2802890.1 hypothetical protein BDZ99DRAFT_468570 [Mytilinidion resinicola]